MHPDFPARKTKTYQLHDLPVGETAVITCRSRFFDARLELLDAESGAIVMVAEQDAARGFNRTDERLQVTATAGSSYLLRVTSENDDGLGDYRIGGFNLSYIDNLLSGISLNESASGTLLNSDPIDPIWYPATYYSYDYRLDFDGSEWFKIMLDSDAFDAYLTIVDAESGLPLFEDDDSGGDLNAMVNFQTIPGLTYLVRVTTAGSMQTGAYTLSVSPGISVPKLLVPGSVSGSLTSTDDEDPNFPGTYMDEYDLDGTSPNQWVTVSMSSSVLDAYLFLLDAETGIILGQNDDASGGSSDASITFMVEGDRTYRIRATSYDEGETGAYTLTAD